MAEYQTPLDIKNRALQHCGVPRIAAATDDAKGAAETEFAYDKLRTAELRRNVWRFAIRKVALRAVNWDTMFLVPAAYQAANTYPIGAIVAWQNATYFSTVVVPINTPPDANPAFWTVYFGPMTVTPWSSSDVPSGYYAGELVYVLLDDVVTVFMSLQTGNTDNPTTILPWDATKTYFKRDTISLAPLSVAFNGIQALFNGLPVYFNPALYQSVTDLNVGNDPLSTPQWELIPPTESDVMSGQNWLQLDAAVIHRRPVYPIGAGPQNQAATRNAFRLPSGFLRRAPQDPKAGAASYLGAPSGLAVDDWVLEEGWLISRDQTVIILRFVADVADVTLMDPMFCEGLGARLGLEICEPLTQSDTKLNTISQIYKTFMSEARAVNGIETGSVEPPLDDYITARL